jgi:hypothetical protein
VAHAWCGWEHVGFEKELVDVCKGAVLGHCEEGGPFEGLYVTVGGGRGVVGR